MKLNILVATSQLNSERGKSLGTGCVDGLARLAEVMTACRIRGDIYDLPNGIRHPDIASPFSLTNGFALNTDEVNFRKIPEINHDKRLLRHVSVISDQYDRFYRHKRTVNYPLKRTLIPWILGECFNIFTTLRYEHRFQQFEAFKERSCYWLDEFALFEVYKELSIDYSRPCFRDKNSPEARVLARDNRDRVEFHKFSQFICFEQRIKVRERLKKLGVGLIVNLPFGVALNSADVFFHPEVFDRKSQVGCSPEPEHGYPEQAWGIASYRELSAGLKAYLEARMTWISELGDGVFLDHLVGWCGQYLLPMTIPPESGYPHGRFQTEDHEERKRNLSWFLEIVVGSGLRVRGEIAGDARRVKATNEVIEEWVAKGRDIGAMSIPRWESNNDRLTPLSKYRESTLTMVETHDTSTLLQYLTNRKGYNDDFETRERILEFCNRVLGLPFFLGDVPLKIGECAEEFWIEVCRRITEGTPSIDLTFTLPGLISLLSADFRSTTIENNINVKPGTSGMVGNGWGNWSYYSPPIEAMLSDSRLKETLEKLGQRRYREFDYFHEISTTGSSFSELNVIYSRIKQREIIFRNAEDKWALSRSKGIFGKILPEAELLVHNVGESEVWERIDIGDVVDLNRNTGYRFVDINNDEVVYSYSTQQLKNDLLFVKMAPDQIHHFLVFPISER